MQEFKLGSDVYLEFLVKVNKKPAMIMSTAGKLYHKDEYVCGFHARYSGGGVSGIIEGEAFTAIGDYVAKFDVFIGGMGKSEHAIPFKITKSVLGKKRIVER